MKETDEDLFIGKDSYSFGKENSLPIIDNNNDPKGNNNDFKLTTTIIKSEEKRKQKKSQDLSEILTKDIQNKLLYNIITLVLIILFISLLFFFKNIFIWLKRNYLSDKSLFTFNIFYENADYSFLLFGIIICIKTISSGLKLLILQSITYILCFIVIRIKNKINKEYNNFQKEKVIFHCSDIIISFLYLGEKLMEINLEKSISKIIKIILIILNINIIIYFVLVEIVNCPFDGIIIDILYSLLISITVYYSIYYIMKFKIKPKKIISMILINIFAYFLITLFFLFIFLHICYSSDKMDYFFVNKILMKKIGFLLYLIFELNYLFRKSKEKKIKFFFLYNTYSNRYLYSETNYIQTALRVLITIIIEHFLLSKLDISYKNTYNAFKCLLIIFLDILHGFLVLFMIKYIFNFIYLNNKSLLDIDFEKPFIRYGSFSEGKEYDPLLFIE